MTAKTFWLSFNIVLLNIFKMTVFLQLTADQDPTKERAEQNYINT